MAFGGLLEGCNSAVFLKKGHYIAFFPISTKTDSFKGFSGYVLGKQSPI
jgi:hypothetical protein